MPHLQISLSKLEHQGIIQKVFRVNQYDITFYILIVNITTNTYGAWLIKTVLISIFDFPSQKLRGWSTTNGRKG